MEEVLKIQYFGIEYVEKIHDEQIINYGKNDTSKVYSSI